MKLPFLLRLPAVVLFWTACALFALCQTAALISAVMVGFLARCAGYDVPESPRGKPAP
jgi:hypothetical protein